MIGEYEIGAFALGEPDPTLAAGNSDLYAGIFDDPGIILDFLIEIEFLPEQS